METATLIDWHAAHTHLLAAQSYLLEHMVEHPEAYSATPEGLRAYREILAAADRARTVIEAAAINGIATNG